MTVIAWDGRTLAADKQSVSSGLCSLVTKVHRIRNHLVGGSGEAPHVREHIEWFRRGADPSDFPTKIRDEKCPSFLLVITPDRKVLAYEDGPYPVEIESQHYAIGSGRDFAMAAMHLGFDAVRAVEVASALSNGCGGGVDVLEIG